MPTTTPAPALSHSLLTRFHAVRQATLTLCRPLSPEDMMVQSCPEASPAKWHLAHTTWFLETFILREFLPAYTPFHPDFLWLFNSYYNSLGDMPEKKLRASFSRPPLADILAYRTHVDTAIEQLLAQPLDEEAARRLTLGFEHEQQHQELLATDIKHALFTNPLHPAYAEAGQGTTPSQNCHPSRSGGPASPLAFTSYTPPNNLAEIGITPDPTTPEAFAFDNETPRHTVYLQPYQLADRLITCAEYLQFMNDNAYTRPELWLAEGWSTMRAEAWQAPLYWQRHAASPTGWRIYTMHGFQDLPESGALAETPVCHISFFEADAYARWKGCRLPTEFEWEHAAQQASIAGNFLESGNLHPAATQPSLYGNTWQWTASPYTGYPGYKPLPGALGEYNGKFMSSQIILRGGSCAPPQTHIRPPSRNFFSPATRWQFTGIRLAQ
jgi:ergothioneine biosynthesis protein EgtB